jgi:KDO2-lipid IV(A) lauroyltransferase
MKKLLKKIKYLIEYVLYVFFVFIFKIIGLDRSSNICGFLARKIGPKFRVTKIAHKNIVNILGKEADAEKIIDEVWDNFGRYIGELPFINTISQKEMDRRVEIVGFENIENFNKDKKPYLVFLSHMANWDFIISNAWKIYPKFSVVYRKANNPYVDKAMLAMRKNTFVNMIAKGPSGARGLVRAIKSGDSIAMLVDQKMNDGMEIPFFGRPAMTANAIAKLSLQYNYLIIPCQIIRTSGSYFKAILHKPIDYIKTDDNERDQYDIMLKINQEIESWIREKPGQWFWFHNRWKD